MLSPQQPALRQVLRSERTHSSPCTELTYHGFSRNVRSSLLWSQKWLLGPGVYRSGAVCREVPEGAVACDVRV